MYKPPLHEIERIVQCADSAAANNLLLALLNDSFKKFGVITSILIDAKSKSIAIEAELKGEDRPTRIGIKEYLLEPDGECSLLTIGEISCSRKLVYLMVKRFLGKGKLSIPVPAHLLGQIL
jgi:hypothetical protein